MKDYSSNYIIDIDDVIYTYRKTEIKKYLHIDYDLVDYQDQPISEDTYLLLGVTLVFRNDKVGDEIRISNILECKSSTIFKSIPSKVDSYWDIINDGYSNPLGLKELNNLAEIKEIIIGYDYGIPYMWGYHTHIYKVKKSGIEEIYLNRWIPRKEIGGKHH